jgi:hypothetical protein
LRHDALDSDDGNLPKAKGGTPLAASKGLLVEVLPVFVFYLAAALLF